eukprot:350530-Chlamydomonas_euryale.AAC.1
MTVALPNCPWLLLPPYADARRLAPLLVCMPRRALWDAVGADARRPAPFLVCMPRRALWDAVDADMRTASPRVHRHRARGLRVCGAWSGCLHAAREEAGVAGGRGGRGRA